MKTRNLTPQAFDLMAAIYLTIVLAVVLGVML
jgi:hypothetical protein